MAVGDRNNGLLHAVRHCFAVLAVRHLGSGHDSSVLLGASLVDGGYLDLAWLYFLRHPVADSRLDGSLRLVLVALACIVGLRIVRLLSFFVYVYVSISVSVSV